MHVSTLPLEVWFHLTEWLMNPIPLCRGNQFFRKQLWPLVRTTIHAIPVYDLVLGDTVIDHSGETYHRRLTEGDVKPDILKRRFPRSLYVTIRNDPPNFDDHALVYHSCDGLAFITRMKGMTAVNNWTAFNRWLRHFLDHCTLSIWNYWTKV